MELDKNYSKFSLGGFTGLFTLLFQTYFLKAPLIVIFSFLSEIGMIVLLTFVGGPSYIPIAISGSLVSTAFLIGSGQLPMEIRNFNISKLRNMIISSPVNPISFIFAVSIGSGIHLVIEMAILFVILIYLVPLSLLSILEIIFILTILWIFGVSFGYVLAIRNMSSVKLRTITQTLRILFVFFAPIYYSVTALPYPLQIISLILPTADAAILLHKIVGIETITNKPEVVTVLGQSTNVLNWLILIIFTILIFIIALKSRRWEDS